MAPIPHGPGPPPVLGAEATGQASWYGHPHHGRRTASGEIYDMHGLTAAHRALPFGTRLLVVNLGSGQSAEVRVNDRGPFVDDRIIDLSYGAARALGAVGPGVIPVRLRVIGLAERDAGGATGGASGFSLQLGAFTSRSRAEALRDAFARDGGEARISEAELNGETYYRVRVGTFPDRAAAEAVARRLAEKGYRALIVER
jgi:rare lipoprotein A